MYFYSGVSVIRQDSRQFECSEFFVWSKPKDRIEILREDVFATDPVALGLLSQMTLARLVRDCREGIIGFDISS